MLNELISLLHTRKTFFPGLLTNPNSTTALLQLLDILHGTKNERPPHTQQLSGKLTSESGQLQANHMFDNNGKKQSLDSLLNGQTKIFRKEHFPMNVDDSYKD